MRRLALAIAAACAAIVGAAALVANSGAQHSGPPTGILGLMSRDNETRFTFVDNPPRRRERAGDLFVINSRLRDSSNRPIGRLHASFAETQPPPRVVAPGNATFILGDGQIVVSGPPAALASRLRRGERWREPRIRSLARASRSRRGGCIRGGMGERLGHHYALSGARLVKCGSPGCGGTCSVSAHAWSAKALPRDAISQHRDVAVVVTGTEEDSIVRCLH
jgi:hypothetical protein